MRHLLIQTRQVEFIIYIILVDLKQNIDQSPGYLAIHQIQDTKLCKLQLTSQKNSFPLRVQNQEIHETSSELLIFLKLTKQLGNFSHLNSTPLCPHCNNENHNKTHDSVVFTNPIDTYVTGNTQHCNFFTLVRGIIAKLMNNRR